MTSGNNYLEAGEISGDSQVEVYTASAAITKGQICQITQDVAGSTVAPTAGTDAETIGPYAVAIESAAANDIVRCVVKGKASVVASEDMGQGAIVVGIGGEAAVYVAGTTLAQVMGRVTVGAPAEGIATVDLGGV